MLGVFFVFSFFVLMNLVFKEYLQIKGLLFSNFVTFFDSLWYTWMTMPIFSQAMLIIVSLLSSLLIVLVFMAYKQNQKLSGSAGSSGIVLGILAPACPSCGIGIFSLLGFGSLSAILPFGGQELGVVAIVVLIGSLMYVSKQLVAKICEV